MTYTPGGEDGTEKQEVRGFPEVVQPESGAEVGGCQQPARCKAIFWGAAEKGDRYGGTTMSKELSAQGLRPTREFKE